MPMHDWTRVGAWLYHTFHRSWVVELSTTLNRFLPDSHYALLTPSDKLDGPSAVVFSSDDTEREPPQVDASATPFFWPNRVDVRRTGGDSLAAIIELVSPGNKDSRHAVRQFARKVVRAVHGGVHVLFVDPFPPRAGDPDGMHNVVWPMLNGDPYHFPPDTPLLAAGYEAVTPPNCFLTPFAVDRPLPDMPVFLEPGLSVTLPLEATYTAAFADVLPMHRQMLGD